eukprot:16263886-Heterocapsa_arctica.AAC.1
MYRRIQEIHEESGQEFLTLLLDWDKAFDNIDQQRMIIVLRRMGIPNGIVELIADMYREPSCCQRRQSEVARNKAKC